MNPSPVWRRPGRLAAFCGTLALATALPAPAVRAEAPALTLDQAVARALQNSGDLAVATARLEEARAARAKVTTAYLPNIQAVGSYTHNSVEAKMDLGKMIGGIGQLVGVTIPPDKLPAPSIIQKQDTLAGVLSLDQTLFALSPLLLAGAADKAVAAQQAGLEATRRELVYQVTQIFYNHAGVLRLIESAQRAIDLADQRVANAQARRAGGSEAEVAVLRAESERDRARGDLLRAQAARRQLLVMLGALLGDTAPAALEVPPTLGLPGGSPDDHRASARRDRPDLEARRLSLQAADAQVREAQLRWLPLLNLQANGRYTDTPGFVGKNWLWAATVNLVVPLFDRGVRYADARERTASRVRLQREYDKAERDLNAALDQAQADLEAAQQSLALAEQQVVRAKRTAAIVASALANGAATSLEQAEADTNLRLTEANAVRERLTLDLGILKVRHLTGAVRAPQADAKL
ncbi:MAG: TolC family protein [Deltaproteobacteria bacterium]|nr:TolC family protein [Deltaproteobacteria bacterium]